MADKDSKEPKRSKTAKARSLLQRVASKNEIPTLSETQASSTRTSAEAPRSSIEELSTSASPTQARTSHLEQRPQLSTITSTDGIEDSAPIQNMPEPTSAIPQGTSIEQSVKLFKVFEALRNGNTAALSNATREEDDVRLAGTTILHLAVQVAEPTVVEHVLDVPTTVKELNSKDKEGNTPLHIASSLGRVPIVKLLLDQPTINDSTTNFQGKTPLDLARNPEIFQMLQFARSVYVDRQVKHIHELVGSNAYDEFETLLTNPRVRSTVDVNGPELATEPQTVESGGTLLHEATRKKDIKLIQMLLLNGADPFRRDRRGKLPQDITKDDRTKTILKRSPAAAAAQRGIQEKSILGANVNQVAGLVPGDVALGTKEAREMKGYLKKWTNYTSGYKLRWFVLEDGVLSYYKQQDDAGSACRGAINMRIAKLHMDPKEKLGFEIHGKSSVKYHLKANHQVEAKRWFWALNNAIQWSKDEARDEQRRHQQGNDALRHTRTENSEKISHADYGAGPTSTSNLTTDEPLTISHSRGGGSITNDKDADGSTYAPSTVGDETVAVHSRANTATLEGDPDDDDEYGDDASSHEAQPASRDAFNITAQSAKLQLELIGQVSTALQVERTQNPDLPISHPSVENALTSYDTATKNLKALMSDLLRISRDHEAYWQYRLDRETNVRRLWEDSMARVAREQEELQDRIGESEEKRKKTKRALRDALEDKAATSNGTRSRATTQDAGKLQQAVANIKIADDETAVQDVGMQRRTTISDYTNNEVSDDESDMDDEFFDAVDAGEIDVRDELPESTVQPSEVTATTTDKQAEKTAVIERSYKGYEDGVRQRLKLDADNRPKVSLWGVLKSMIGKDMSKMTLPVTFNEPTSLLYRVVEDMEYTDLLNSAAERSDSTERMVYVAAFAASEYASTIGRVAKPFNPLLGETYEYVRPDKGYRFFIEQVSHHPPVGAAFAESAKWDYYGESSVKSKFYGKSFEFNPLGTWFLRLRPDSGPEELYTWKKVTSSVVGIITGNPTVDNYGPMEVKNWSTGETCLLEFKARGWKANSAYQVSGKVVDAQGQTRWSLGGRWNDKIYARLTPGYEGSVDPSASRADTRNDNQAFLVWEANPRPTGIPFNLTPFAVTLNALPDRLKPHLAPTDTRLRPDQRAMEDGEYDFAAKEKLRLEEKQRAKRRQREQAGEEFVPKWFEQDTDATTGEKFWKFNGEYWRTRDQVSEGKLSWQNEGLEEIF